MYLFPVGTRSLFHQLSGKFIVILRKLFFFKAGSFTGSYEMCDCFFVPWNPCCDCQCEIYTPKMIT